MTIISKAQSEEVPRVLLFLDAEKAFEHIEWPYLHIVSEKFGLGPWLLAWLKILYRAQKILHRAQTAIISIEGINRNN